MLANPFLPVAAHTPANLYSETKGDPFLYHDPHVFPEIETASQARVDPILYLPPLLSSLPGRCHHDISHVCHGTQHSHKPLHTSTHLPDIDTVSLSLHRALHDFHPVDRHYASKPYDTAFNWSQIELPVEEEREWYCVAFRSIRKKGSNGDALYSADERAHEEAIRSGGLIMYWYGVPDGKTGLNLATCIWQSRKHAIAGSSSPAHAQAMRLAAHSYELYTLERYVLSKKAGERTVTIEEYRGGDVGW